MRKHARSKCLNFYYVLTMCGLLQLNHITAISQYKRQAEKRFVCRFSFRLYLKLKFRGDSKEMKRLFFVGLFVLILEFGAFAQKNDFDAGLMSAKSGDFQTALQHFQKAIDKNLSAKKLAQIHYNIGVCFYRLNHFERAVTEFEQAVRLNPNYEKAFYALGMAEKDLRNFAEAEKAFRQALKLSNRGETWFDLAVVFFELKNYDESAESFRNAIKFGSESVGASHNNLGVIYALRGDFWQAEKELEIAEKLNFAEAETNLDCLRRAMISNDMTLIAKLILKEKIIN